jgi:hypothetical protein
MSKTVNDFIKKYIITENGEDNCQPVLNTTYYTVKNTCNFEMVSHDIQKCDQFTDIQKDHFIQCVDFLKKCNLNLNEYDSINIKDASNFYIHMNNSTEYPKTTSRICINYVPRAFNPLFRQYAESMSSNLSEPKIIVNPVNMKTPVLGRLRRFFLCVVKRFNSWNKKGQLIKFSNNLIQANCFAFLLYFYLKKITSPSSFKSPIVLGLLFGFMSISMTRGAEIISNVYPLYSNLLTNGMMFIANHMFWKKVPGLLMN